MSYSSLSSLTQTRIFPGRLDSLSKISEFVVAAAEAAGLRADALCAVETAVDEACANIIEHAYGGEGLGDIECVCHINHGRLMVTLRDFGCPFDPSSVPEPDLSSALEDRQEGGLGLYLMRKLMDEVHFEFTSDAGNILTMVKREETNP